MMVTTTKAMTEILVDLSGMGEEEGDILQREPSLCASVVPGGCLGNPLVR